MPAKSLVAFDAVKDSAAMAFGNVSILRDAEGISGHPEGPNCMMRQALWHCHLANLGPWTFIEPDCIPLTTDWADAWEREYRAFGKPFMGELRPANGVTPDYLTGNMVLPADALIQAPMLARRGLSRDGVELAFDIVAAGQTLPKAHLTKLLQQVPKNPDGSSATFPDQSGLSILRPGAVLFHPCKDGTLIDRLLEQKGGDEPCRSQSPVCNAAQTFEPDAPQISLSTVSAPQTLSDQIRALCKGLSALIGDTPARKQMVQRELRSAGLIGKAKARKGSG